MKITDKPKCIHANFMKSLKVRTSDQQKQNSMALNYFFGISTSFFSE